jgi:hypothetical protein
MKHVMQVTLYLAVIVVCLTFIVTVGFAYGHALSSIYSLIQHVAP